MNSIGILGGSFDPIHLGHLRLAEQVRSGLSLDEVHFLPCAIPVHRQRPLVSDADRVEMIKIAIASFPEFKLNHLELNRGGPSYMVDTLTEIRAQNPADTLVLILGADAFNQFRQWKSPDRILDLAHLAVCTRPGNRPDKSIYAERWIDSPDSFWQRPETCILPLDIDENPCSSTHVRSLLSNHDRVDQCLPPSVHQYIQSKHLYE